MNNKMLRVARCCKMFVGFPSVGMYRRLRREKFGTCLGGTRTCFSCREIRIPGVVPIYGLGLRTSCLLWWFFDSTYLQLRECRAVLVREVRSLSPVAWAHRWCLRAFTCLCSVFACKGLFFSVRCLNVVGHEVGAVRFVRRLWFWFRLQRHI